MISEAEKDALDLETSNMVEDAIKALEDSMYTLFFKSESEVDLSNVHEEDCIGFTTKHDLKTGEYLSNPFSNQSYLKIEEIDFINDRILLSLVQK